MTLRYHASGLLSGAANMAIDTALARALDEKRAGPALRLYGWQPHALSLGFHQDEEDVDRARCTERGIDIVRRPTGGKAILHADEVTYCVVLPLAGSSPRALYRQVNECLIRGLRLLGVDAILSDDSDDLRTLYHDPAGLPCFTSTARSELLVGGRKLVGSAQRKIGGVILQHGSVLIGSAHRAIADLLSPRLAEVRAAIARDLEEKTTEIETLLGRSVSYEEVAEALREGFATSPGFTLVDAPLGDEILSTISVPA